MFGVGGAFGPPGFTTGSIGAAAMSGQPLSPNANPYWAARVHNLQSGAMGGTFGRFGGPQQNTPASALRVYAENYRDNQPGFSAFGTPINSGDNMYGGGNAGGNGVSHGGF
jgi:hypothetical protein